jgi:CheY-like chemotaxis protein
MDLDSSYMSKRILIIDDEKRIRQMLRLTLSDAGYEVGEAESGMEAFAILGSDPSWDVALLDQKMPGMEGLDVLRRIKVLAPALRVIMITAYASIELAVDAMKLGATDFVRKPMTPEVIRNALVAALAKPALKSAVVTVPESTQTPEHAHGQMDSLIEVITMNGFSIVRPPATEGAEEEPDKRRFIVKNPNGWEREVVVHIAPEAVEYVERLTHRIPVESAFWTYRAEHYLSVFLWNEGQIPSGGSLTLKGVSRDELLLAARCDGD